MGKQFSKLMWRGRSERLDPAQLARLIAEPGRASEIEIRRWEIDRVGPVIRAQDLAHEVHAEPPRLAISFSDTDAAEAAEQLLIRCREREGFVRCGDDDVVSSDTADIPTLVPDRSDPEIAIVLEMLASTTGTSPASLTDADLHDLVGVTPPEQLRWRGGCVEAATIQTNLSVRAHEQVLDLLQSPLGHTVTSLRIDDHGWPDDALDATGKSLVELLAVARPGLHELHLQAHDLGDVTPALAALPTLRSLTLWAWYWKVHAVTLPRLERFDARLHHQGWSTFASLREMCLPNLRAFHTQHAECDPYSNFIAVGDEFVRPLRAAAWFGQLHELAIRAITITRGFVEALCACLPERIEVLDLAYSYADRAAARAIVDRSGALQGLSTLRLPDVDCMRAVVDELRARLPTTNVELTDAPP